MRAELAAGEALLPDRDVASNLVYTVTVVDAIEAIARGAVAPGVYDLMSVPQLTWRQVYEAEREIAGLPAAEIRVAPGAARARRATPGLRRVARLAGGELARNVMTKLLARAPRRLNARAHAWWTRARARAEIAALAAGEAGAPRHARPMAGHLSWVANGSRFIEGLTPTLELLARRPYGDLADTRLPPWPPDLPAAFAPYADVVPAGDAGVVGLQRT